MKTENNRFDDFKKAFDESFGKVTPSQFIKQMEDLGYKFIPDAGAPPSKEVKSIKEKMIVGEDIICPVTKKHCDDECCPPGAECNISGEEIVDCDNIPESLPILSKEGKSAEEIKTAGEILSRKTHHEIDGITIRHGVLVKDALEAMKEYAQQFQSTPISEDKEKKLKDLCEQVMDSYSYFAPDNNGPDLFRCFYCGNEHHESGSKIQHESGCAYLIAKELSTLNSL